MKNLEKYEDDDELELNQYRDMLNSDVSYQKKAFISEINKNGDLYLMQINKKHKKELDKKYTMIDYIISNSDKYERDELVEYDVFEIEPIYIRLVESQKPLIVRIFNIIFGLKR